MQNITFFSYELENKNVLGICHQPIKTLLPQDNAREHDHHKNLAFVLH